MKIVNIVGARPNFMKIAPIVDAIEKYNEQNCRENTGHIKSILIHTGQHYDEKMSKTFFHELGIPRPDIDLGVGSGSHAEQTAEIMKRFEPVLLKEDPDYILVVGDVNSTIACALTASKLGIKIIHVESGLRSFDRNMPEEINRVLTDAISDLLFTSERKAEENLLREGIGREKIHFVGNVMIDTLLKHRERAKSSKILETLGLVRASHETGEQPCAPYGVLTLHRPDNVDDKEKLASILEGLTEIARDMAIVFPVHPRTGKNIQRFGLESQCISRIPGGRMKKGIYLVEPLGYLDFLHLTSSSSLVLTDSGGIQEETTAMGVPCLTLRENTERPVTVSEGTNSVVGTDKDRIIEATGKALGDGHKKGHIPELWDGKAAERIVSVIVESHDNVKQKG